MISPQTQAKLNTLAEVYAREIYTSVYQAISKYSNTRAGEDSLKVTWLKATDNFPPRILVIYEEHVQLYDVRKMSWVRMPNMSKLQEWASTKTFNTIPGYTNTPGIPEFKQQARVAFAIAKDKRKNDTFKRKPWRKKALSQVLKDMNRETLETYRKEVEDILAESISTGAVLS